MVALAAECREDDCDEVEILPGNKKPKILIDLSDEPDRSIVVPTRDVSKAWDCLIDGQNNEIVIFLRNLGLNLSPSNAKYLENLESIDNYNNF